MLLLHISDTHLGKRQYGLDERETDIYDTFSSLIDEAIKDHVKAVIHTGDLFDVPNPPNNALYHAMKEIMRLRQAGIEFLSIPGDHDTPKRAGEKYPQKILEIAGLRLLNDASIDLEDGGTKVRIFGVKHKPSLLSEQLKDQLRETKPTPGFKNVIMMHQGIREVLPFAYSWQISQGDIPLGFDYYALGHFHTRMLQKFSNGQLGVAGSPDIIREEEIEGYKKNGKGAFLVDLSSGETTVQRINIDIRPQEIVSINSASYKQEIDNLVQEIPVKYKKKPIIHIEINGNPSKYALEYMTKLQEVVLHYRITKYNTEQDQSKGPTMPSNSTVDELIRKFFEGKGYSKQEIDIILEMIKNTDNEASVKESLQKISMGDRNEN
ncbi:DNA double-strand break repair protein Mre11 [Sulfuracidifex tepidarius]|uniref:DNA double-strand break repair protein Mre11 n=1 Tax=Sulfuracidifex tepidarius TaxID=1294262 RepID=A0A510E6G9_9CREN|nr:DNA double-strand break repair protein Mre11 [Sulfuracidifex tepidarius]BBG25347.1 DNA double-strand break repair protein Mre11 [Sulfuracidifex tepidarius]BBG28141.1 DNA double-strand break repair protein Mre11 [Sulfuracidifex tepidarius]